MKKHLILSILTSVFFVSSFSQSITKTIRMGDDAFSDGDYYAAYLYYEEALKTEAMNIDLIWKSGESCRLFNNYEEAAKKYKTVYEFDKTEKFPESLFWYAMMLKQSGKYNEAQNIFRQYSNIHKSDKSKFSIRALQEIIACAYADSARKDSLQVLIKHLGDNINTPYAESAGINVSDSIFYFASLQLVQDENNDAFIPIETQYLTKIFKARIENKKIQDAEEVEKINVTTENKHHTTGVFSPDKKRFYFTRCDEINMSKYRCSIYVSEFSKGKFKEPKRLNDSINYPGSNTTHPHVAKIGDKEVLFFSSDRQGGMGGMDIWYCFFDGKKYSKVANAGKMINTQWDEITPFYKDKMKKIFFSSDGHLGFGGFDIYYSIMEDLKNYTPAKNIGYPINSPANDFFFTVNEKDTNGFITSNRLGSFYIKGETCCNDIFSFEWLKKREAKKDTIKKTIPVAVVQIKKDTSTVQYKIREMLPISLYFHNDEPDKKTLKTTTLKDYEQSYFEYLAMKEEYRREFSKGLVDKHKMEAEEAIENFFKEFVKAGYEKLKKYCSLLQMDLEAGKEVKITVKGYCSPLTTNAYNRNLAKRRISSMLNYFSKFNNGAIKKYVDGTASNGGSLKIIEEPIGEEMVNSNVSDNPNDKRNSIFSVSASMERRIQILKYSSEQENISTEDNTPVAKDTIIYRVQLLSSPLPVDSNRFASLFPLYSEVNKRGIKFYFAGEFNSVSDANTAKINLKTIGFKDAYVVAFRNGKKISMVDAQVLIDNGEAEIPKDRESILQYKNNTFYDKIYE